MNFTIVVKSHVRLVFPPARNQAFDVVLVDTAGRMQDNAPLMTALAKLIAVNMPDLVLFVGEALVGNEAVDQLVRPRTDGDETLRKKFSGSISSWVTVLAVSSSSLGSESRTDAEGKHQRVVFKLSSRGQRCSREMCCVLR